MHSFYLWGLTNRYFKLSQTLPSNVVPTTVNANPNFPDVEIKDLKSLLIPLFFSQLSSNPSANSLDSRFEIKAETINYNHNLPPHPLCATFNFF